ncbi:MBL fold metallo-hydrolase RNA specificity domain-containing protein [Pelagicoccus albus]|uniref:ATP-dependent DNA ligase family profile domain-containing protein n=1 Tax=Pelagicoccus albus TaxID=415222 RepID=A0A7X1B9F7_9BACT|nr:MBL fold metallo-hydrolase RNA specificity domain-containing protein [Pelagicoccus albus]MBC2608142.1 hypothetical protein [Pelagicoccus albus]
MNWRIEKGNGFFLPAIGWHLDARKPVHRSFVSHAHFDHMGAHDTILCSPATAKLMQRRISGKRNWIIHDFGETFELKPGVTACFYPAGHIIGSTMLWLEKEGRSFLYTGDFKLTRGISAEVCQPVKADTLVLESTYGLPRYTFPPEEQVFGEMIQFCRDTLDNGDTPVIFGYSLGKSQAILRSLAEAKLEVMLHPQVLKLTRSCEELGWEFPPYFAFAERQHEGKVIISPPMPKDSEWMQSIRKPKTAMISGWALDPSSTFRYQCDKTFPISDHADYLDLLSFVAKVDPSEVYTVHGFAKEFAATLREQGYQAFALNQENQLGLDLPAEPVVENDLPQTSEPKIESVDDSSYAAFAQLYESLCQTDSIRKKQDLLDSHLAKLSAEDCNACISLLDTPDPAIATDFPPKRVLQSLLLATGTSESEYKQLHQQLRNTQTTAAKLLGQQSITSGKSLRDLQAFLKALAAAPNPIFKQSLLSEQFRKLWPAEGVHLLAYLSHSTSHELSDEIFCQAIAQRFGQNVVEVRAAYLRNGRLLPVLQAAADHRLDSIRICYFQPIAPLQAKLEFSPEAVMEKQGLSLWAEPEHDGMRCQIHKNGEHVDLYDASGDRITHLFPELVETARSIPQHFIADAAVVPWGYESPLPRSELDKRLTLRAEDLFLGEDVEVTLWLFDLLCLNGEDLLDKPLEERRQKLDTFSVTPKIRITPVSPLMGVDQVEEALEQTTSRGNKGLLFKDPQSAYDPLAEAESWLKLR